VALSIYIEVEIQIEGAVKRRSGGVHIPDLISTFSSGELHHLHLQPTPASSPPATIASYNNRRRCRSSNSIYFSH
jgi:hypothetical protein